MSTSHADGDPALARDDDDASAYDSPPPSPIRRPVELHGQGLKDALDYCDREPIRMPGCVQPFAAVVVVHSRTLRMVAASINLEGIVGVPLASLRGKVFGDSFGPEAASVLKKFRASPQIRHVHEQPYKAPGADPQPISLAMHKQGKHILVEFEQSATFGSTAEINRNMRQALERIIAAEAVASAVNVLTEEMRRISGYHRIMVYRFDDEYNGEVVAESRNEAAFGSYLGIRFPAADIPRQARQLYLRNWFRCIMDVDAVPSPVVATDSVRGEPNEWPLDMTDLHCRAVSPIHLQYLRNMAVRASMSLSIVHNNKLWGLVACHHAQPALVPVRLRSTLELMAVAFSAHIGRLQALEYNRHCLSSENTLRRLLSHNVAHWTDLMRFVEANTPDLMAMFHADGIALIGAPNSGPLFALGYVPRISPGLRYWLDAACGFDGSRIAWTNCLSRCAVDASETVGGVLAMPVPNGHFLLAFRRGVVQTADWGGATPDSVKMIPMRKASEEVMGPRVSFEMWRVEYRDRSLPWSATELREAEALVSFLRASCEGTWQPSAVAHAAAAIREVMDTAPGSVGGVQASHALSVVEGCLALLRAGDTGEETSAREATQLRGLVEGMLDLSKADADLLTIEAKPFSIHEIVGACLDASPAGIRTSCVWEGGMWALGDGMVFHRIVAAMVRAVVGAAKGDASKVGVVVATSTASAPAAVTATYTPAGLAASSGTQCATVAATHGATPHNGAPVAAPSTGHPAGGASGFAAPRLQPGSHVQERGTASSGVKVRVSASCRVTGISLGDAQALFEPFSHVAESDGVALPVARKLALAMCGRLEGRVDTTAEGESELVLEFESVFPEFEASDDRSSLSAAWQSDSSRSSLIESRSRGSSHREGAGGVPSLEHMRLLLVDADPVNAHVFRVLAGKLDVGSVEIAATGADAMKALGIGAPSTGSRTDAVFVNPRAPGAREALEVFSAASCVPVVVMVHGGVKPADLSAWMAHGADACIASPCDLQELRDTLVRFRPQVLADAPISVTDGNGDEPPHKRARKA